MNELFKLHLGSGAVRLPGWKNIDLEAPEADLLLDLRQPLPFPDGSVSHVFSEHVIEHIERHEALSLLRECRRLLVPDGVVRVTTPDLAWLVDNYAGAVTDGWGDQWQPGTPARLINEGMRSWGHCFIYDRPELARLFREAGFSDIRFVDWRSSSDPVLDGLETRPFNNEIVIEARIPQPAEAVPEPVVRPVYAARGEASLLQKQGQELESLRILLDQERIRSAELEAARRGDLALLGSQMDEIRAESTERARLLMAVEEVHRSDELTVSALRAESANLAARNEALLETVSQLHGVRAELVDIRAQLDQVATESRQRAEYIDQLGETIHRHEAYMARLRASLPGRILFRLFRYLS